MAEEQARQEMEKLLIEQNSLIRRQIKDNNNWGLILLRGMVMGLGTAIGATVILSLAIWALRPLQSIEPLRPAVDRLVDVVERLERSRGQSALGSSGVQGSGTVENGGQGTGGQGSGAGEEGQGHRFEGSTGGGLQRELMDVPGQKR